MLPPLRRKRVRTSEPSGATAERLFGKRFVLKSLMFLLLPWEAMAA
jgi:hypothetical protein